MKTFINCTPHAIRLNDGTIYEPSGTIARVSSSFTNFDEDGVCRVKYGEVTGLPGILSRNYYIVSAMVLAASDRDDLVAPATGHPDCIRDKEGHIVSVPGFIGK